MGECQIASQTQDGKLIVNEAAKFWMTSATNGAENKTFNLNWAFSNNSTVSTDGGNGMILQSCRRKRKYRSSSNIFHVKL